MLADLADRHPALDTRLTEVDPHLSVDLVASGAVDLAIAHDWDIAPLPAPPGVEQAAIGEDLCDLLVPAGHPFAGRDAVRREDLGGERWICQPPGRVCHDWLVRTLRAAGCEPDIVHQADENPTLVALVAAGLGVALIPRLGRGPLPHGVVEVPLDPHAGAPPVRAVARGRRGRRSRRRSDPAGALARGLPGAGSAAFEQATTPDRRSVGADQLADRRSGAMPLPGFTGAPLPAILGRRNPPAPSVDGGCRRVPQSGVGLAAGRDRRPPSPPPAAGSTPPPARPLRPRRWRPLLAGSAVHTLDWKKLPGYS